MTDYIHACEPTTHKPPPHPGIERSVTRWRCPDCDAKWEVTWRYSGQFGEPTSAQASRLSGPSKRWQRAARQAVNEASRPLRNPR